MAIIENRMVLAVGFVDLIQRLCNQETTDVISGHEGQHCLEEIQLSQRRKFIEHQ